MSDHALAFCLWAIAGFFGLGLLLTVASVGKPREPMKGGAAAVIVLLDVAMVLAIATAAVRLQ